MVFQPPRSNHGSEVTKLKMRGDSFEGAVEVGNQPKPIAFRMGFEGSNKAARAFGVDILPGKSNYFIGRDPSKWHTVVPHYAKVRYDNVYPGIDLIYYGIGKYLEYDFVVAPGADPKDIRISFEGADRLQVNDRGDLVLTTALGDIYLRRPLVYQDIDGARRTVGGRYVPTSQPDAEHFTQPSDRTLKASIEVDEYDTAKPLVIDPIIVYSTYFGSAESQFASAVVSSVAVDSSGNAYITGQTASDQFPTTNGALMTSRGADGCPLPPCADAFVSKFSPEGQLVYSTYFGGNSEDSGNGIAVSPDGNVFVTGKTVSTDFPVSINAFQTTPGGLSDAFVAKLNPEGSALIYSTYLGGNGNEHAAGIAIDAAGNAYIAGETLNYLSPDFPPAILFPSTLNAFQSICPQSAGGAYCGGVFLTKLNATGSALVYSSFLGGADGFSRVFGIAVDASQQAYVFGTTSSSDFPIMNAFQSTCHACAFSGDVFLTKFNPTGSGLVYSTYIGGSLGNGVYGGGVAVDPSGNAYVTSWTASPDFPTTDGAFKEVCDGAFTTGECSDIFVTKFGPAGNMVYSTILGPGQSAGIAVDSIGNAYLTGTTSSQTFPIANALQTDCLVGTLGYCWDAFITELNATGSGLVYSTYLGGESVDQASGIAIDHLGSAVVVGSTVSHDFPVVNPVQDNCDSCPPSKIFVTKLSPLNDPSADVVVVQNAVPDSVSVGGSVTYTITVTNSGPDTATNVVLTDTLPNNMTFVSGSTSRGICFLGPPLQCYFSTLDNGESATVSITATATQPGAANNLASVTHGEDDPSLANNSATVAMTIPSIPVTFLLTVSPAPANGLISTVGISCSSGGNGDCSETYNSGVIVILTATPFVGYQIASWTGCNPINNQTQCTVSMTQSRTVSALFTRITHTLTVNSSNPNSGVFTTISPNDNIGQGSGLTQLVRVYNENDGVAITAPATVGDNSFSNWNGCNSTNGTTCNIFMSRDKAITVSYISPPLPSLSISSPSVVEGNSGTITAVFTVTLSTSSNQTVTVDYNTTDGSATADNDYVGTSGILTFNPGDMTQTITIEVNGDTIVEPNETFFVNLTDAVNANIVGGQGVGTIIDDDMEGIVPVFCPTESLQAAIDAAPPGRILTVFGMCSENVLVRNEKQRITLDGGGTAGINAPSSSSSAVTVRGKGIMIRGFTVRGGSDGVVADRNSNVVINNNVIEGTAGNGITVDQLSFAVITNNTIQNNPGAGIFVSEHSAARIGFNEDTETSASTNTIENNALGVVVSNGSSTRVIGNVIQNNSGDGIFVTRDSQADVASNSIDGNGGNGIELREGSMVQLGEDSGTSIYETPNTTGSANTGFGIRCSDGAVVDGRLGSLTGTSGTASFDTSCLDSLAP